MNEVMNIELHGAFVVIQAPSGGTGNQVGYGPWCAFKLVEIFDTLDPASLRLFCESCSS